MRVKRFFMLVCLWVLILPAHVSYAKEYFFLATEDDFYENPENWYPSYPGASVHKTDTISILADVFVKGYHLHIHGQMEIQMGTTIHLLGGNVLIWQGGTLQNGGKIIANKIENYGYLNNSLSAEINVNEYLARPGSITFNSSSAKFITIKDLSNRGIFNNYNYCLAGDIFHNHAYFRQIHSSRLEINGSMFLSNESVLFLSRDSKILLGSDRINPLDRYNKNILRINH